jgi:hypothetical protein
MQNSMARSVPKPRAGIIDDIEEEDEAEGYEPEDAVRVDVALVFLPNTAPVLAGWEVAA